MGTFHVKGPAAPELRDSGQRRARVRGEDGKPGREVQQRGKRTIARDWQIELRCLDLRSEDGLNSLCSTLVAVMLHLLLGSSLRRLLSYQKFIGHAPPFRLAKLTLHQSSPIRGGLMLDSGRKRRLPILLSVPGYICMRMQHKLALSPFIANFGVVMRQPTENVAMLCLVSSTTGRT